jgi:hypothetical protein
MTDRLNGRPWNRQLRWLRTAPPQKRPPPWRTEDIIVKMMRLSVSVAVLASAIAAAGCSAEQFTSLNQTFAATKKGAVVLSDTALPAAAIATSLGAVELLKQLSNSNAKALLAGGAGNFADTRAGVVATGGGNLTSGGQNFAPMFHLAEATGSHDEDVANDKLKVKMHVAYNTSLIDGTYASTISSFKGTSQGYTIDAQGSFRYHPQAGSASVAAQMTGTVSYKDLKLSIKELTFATSDPLPATAELGSFVFEQNSGGKVTGSITAKLKLADGQISASGTYLDKEGKTKPISFDQSNPTGASAATSVDTTTDSSQ